MRPENKKILRTLISLAVPTIVQEIMGTLLMYVDTAMVGHLGEKATAAVSTTTTVTWLVAALPYSFAIGLMAMMSRAYGAKDNDRMHALAELAVKMVLIIGSGMTIICVGLSPFIPGWMQAAPVIRRQASLYFAIICLPAAFRAGSSIFGTCIQAVKDTRTPMIVNLSSNVANVILNYLLIYVCGLGVTGAAIATALSYAGGGTAMAVIFLGRKEFGRPVPFKRRGIDRALFTETAGIALPALGTSVISCAGYVVFAAMVSGMGTTVFAAHSIAVSAEELFYLPGYGLRTATSALVGISIGEKDLKKLRVVKRQSVLITIGMMCVTGSLLYLVAFPMMRLFTSSAEVAVLGAAMLRIVAFSEPFFGLMIVWEGICYGFGLTKRVLAIESVSMWGVRILLTFLVVEIWGLGLKEVWYCMVADNVFKATALTFINLVRPPEKSYNMQR
jgi:putative MATE family efflux protein